MSRYIQSPFLPSLELADASDGNTPLEVNLLIGSDYYWQQLTGEIRWGEEGPIAVLTQFGLVLSGPIAATGQEAPVVALVSTHTLRVDAEANHLKELDDCMPSFILGSRVTGRASWRRSAAGGIQQQDSFSEWEI